MTREKRESLEQHLAGLMLALTTCAALVVGVACLVATVVVARFPNASALHDGQTAE
jgi:hypothetical protein